jgi:hypothetical protein
MNFNRFAPRLVLAVLLLSSAVFADSFDSDIWFFGTTGESASFDPNSQTLTLTSTVTETIAIEIQTGNQGTLTVTTGPLISGSILHHAVFGSSSITIGGISGTLDSLNWYQVPNSNEFHLAGTGSSGQGDLVFGPFRHKGIVNFDELVVLSGPNQFTVLEGRVGLIPEPSTLALLATGLGLFSGAGVRRFIGKGSRP